MQNGPNSGFYSPSQAARVLSLSKRRVLQFLERGELAGDKDPRGRWLIARADLFALQERREQEQRQRPGPKSEQPPAGEPDPALVEVAGGAAHHVDADDADALTSVLQVLAGDDAERARLRRAGPARAAAFSWDHTAEATLPAYRLAAERSHG